MEDLNRVLGVVFLPQYHEAASEWLLTASVPERKGLKMLGAIYKHKGQKKFRTVPSTALQTRQTSTYEAEFTSEVQSRPSTAVLSYNRFSTLPCSQILTPVTVRFVESWLLLRDAEGTVSVLLDTLRAIFAYFTSSKRPTTESKRQYVWNDLNTLPKAHRLDHLTNKSQVSRSASAGRPWVAPRSAEPQDTSHRPSAFTAEDLKKRKEAQTKGSGQVATWIVGPSDLLSNYQNTYTTHFNKYKGMPTGQHQPSVSLGRMIPGTAPLGK